ncbi:MAG: HK97 family phage prohead protease [Microcella sp.]|uniref:HK97 family phage prohead protease n=1 Tax=Microcella sp. TaxID=1913979 RepID=UPI0027198597|nr:HK97 family phage prohead protease [Microcella sp.]MDO8338432.1 HK97 family phage prohead protease [Microcella sp.]
MRQLVDKPRQRRLSKSGTGRGAPLPAPWTAREASTSTEGLVRFTGLASAYESPYEMWDIFGPYTEVVSLGAGAKSLARDDLDVTLNLGHDQMHRIASTLAGTLNLSESSDGLEVDASLNPDDPDVQLVMRKIEDGLYREMSFAFHIVRGSWSPDWTEYRIDEYDLHRGDVAIVGYGANPATVAQLRHSGADLIPEHRTQRLLLV